MQPIQHPHTVKLIHEARLNEGMVRIGAIHRREVPWSRHGFGDRIRSTIGRMLIAFGTRIERARETVASGTRPALTRIAGAFRPQPTQRGPGWVRARAPRTGRHKTGPSPFPTTNATPVSPGPVLGLVVAATSRSPVPNAPASPRPRGRGAPFPPGDHHSYCRYVQFPAG
jgi:hypothetical protein